MSENPATIVLAALEASPEGQIFGVELRCYLQRYDRRGQHGAGNPRYFAPWPPLSATAGAVVTEVGGILSHSAIMACEYGVPAVLGISNATTLLVNGQKVEVDGGAGVVRLLEV